MRLHSHPAVLVVSRLRRRARFSKRGVAVMLVSAAVVLVVVALVGGGKPVSGHQAGTAVARSAGSRHSSGVTIKTAALVSRHVSGAGGAAVSTPVAGSGPAGAGSGSRASVSGCVRGPMCAAAGGSTGSTGTAGSSGAQAEAVAALGLVARCYAAGKSGNACMGPGVVGVSAGRYGRGAGEVFVLASPTGYQVSSVSGSGETFTIDHDPAGQVVRICTPVGVDGCSKEGSW